MSKSRTIQVPRELVEEWISQIWHEGTPVQVAASDLHLASQAAQWGADQELEACRQWLEINGAPREFIDGLLAARRPSLSPVERVRSRLAYLMDRIATEGAIATAEPIRECLEILEKLETQNG